MNRIALINDLSGYGKCSITTQIPVISAFGDVASCLLTSYLSNHTGFSEFNKVDLSNDLKKNIEVWKKNQFTFNGIMTGYISNAQNILDVKDFIINQKVMNNCLLLVDPCFADNGNFYCNMTNEHVENYKKLMEIANIVTPNITEACYLTGCDYESIRVKCGLLRYEGNEKSKIEHVSKKIIEAIKDVLQKLPTKKQQISVITGIELYNSVVTVLDVVDGDKDIRQTTCNYAAKLDNRPGTGDLFDAFLFETILHGYNLIDSFNITLNFVHNALKFSRDQRFRIEEGVIFEPILLDNMIVLRNKTKTNNSDKNKNEDKI